MRFFQVLLVVFSCALVPEAKAGTSISIVTDIAPIRALVRSVTGPDLHVEQIVPDGVSPHEFALKPSQLRALQGADLIVWLGPIAMPGLAKLMAEPSLSAKAITLNQLKNTRLLPLRRTGLVADARAGNGAYDPHSWLDPLNAITWIEEIARALSASDPASATMFQHNAKAEINRIHSTVVSIQTRLASGQMRPFVQFHDAFQYFEHRFGLTPLGLATTGDLETTSLGVTTALRAALAEEKSACVFTASAAQVARAGMLLHMANVTLGRLDALGREIPPGRLDYPVLLNALADGFTACLVP